MWQIIGAQREDVFNCFQFFSIVFFKERYDYPATCLAEIGLALAPVMPVEEEIQKV